MDEENRSDGCHTLSSLGKLPKIDDDLCEKREEVLEESASKCLKKACFVWQIKGNYHLKNSKGENDAKHVSDNQSSEASSSKAQDPLKCDSAALSVNELSNKSGLISSACDHSEPIAMSEHDTVSQASDKQYTPLPPLRIGATTVSCVVYDTFSDNIREASRISASENSILPSPLPTSHPDWNVRKWQTKQMAMASVDNAINHLLEDAPSWPEFADDARNPFNFPLGRIFQHVNFDAVVEEDDSVENEGILSAIQRHGLQRHRLQSLPEDTHGSQMGCSSSRSSISISKTQGAKHQRSMTIPYHGNELPSTSKSVTSFVAVNAESQLPTKIDILSDSSRGSHSDCGEARDSSVPTSPFQCAFLNVMNKTDTVSNTPESFHQVASSSVDSNDLQANSENSDEEVSSGVSMHGSQLSHQYSPQIVHEKSEKFHKRQKNNIVSSHISKKRCLDDIEDDSNTSSSSSRLPTTPDINNGLVSIVSDNTDRGSPTLGHFDFMDAAVAAAIQKKGLSALACQDL